MAGANLKSKNRLRLYQLFWNYMSRTPGASLNRLGRPRRARFPTFLFKHGAPVSNAAGDAPDRKNQICIDTLNDDCYWCSAFTNATTHTWVKVSD